METQAIDEEWTGSGIKRSTPNGLCEYQKQAMTDQGFAKMKEKALLETVKGGR
jgi:hypothetical protein